MDETNEEIVIRPVVCKACNWRWTPRLPGRPSRCPKCGSATWDTGRRRDPYRRRGENVQAAQNANVQSEGAQS